MDQNMNIVIGATVANATQGLNIVAKELANTAIAAGKTDSSIGKIGASSYTTRFAVQNLANVFRDLPFAINNPAIGATVIDHVFASIQALKSETGSLKGAFGALAGSLSGTGGLLVLMNLAGAAISLFAQSSHEAKQAADEFGKSVGSEIANFKILTEAATNVGNSYEIRKKAADEVLKQFPALKAATTEQAILEGKAADAIERVNLALIQKAYYEAASAKITALAVQGLQLDKEKGVLLQKQLDVAVEINKETKIANSNTGSRGASQGVTLLKRSYDDVGKSISDNAKKQADLNKQIDFYVSEAGRFAAAKISLDPDPNGKVHAGLQKIAKDYVYINANIKNIKYPSNITIETGDNINKVQSLLDKKPLHFTFKPFTNAEAIKFTDGVTKALSDSITSSLENVGEAIGSGKSPFTALFKTISGGIKQLGDFLIQYGVEIGIIQKIFSNPLNPLAPGLAIAAGIALEVLSGALTAHIPKFATGGLVTRPTLALIGEQGPEKIVPLGQVSSNGNSFNPSQFVFKIQGNDLVAVYNRQIKSNSYIN